MQRRSFLQLSGSAFLLKALNPLSSMPALFDQKPLQRKFTMSLNAGAIGVSASLEELINYAIDFDFEALSPPTGQVSGLTEDELKQVRDKMDASSLQWGSAGLPVDFRKDLATFNQGVDALPGVASALQRAGVTRMNTWIMPRHDTLTYLENFELHAERLKKIGQILGDHDIRFGLEYVGPLTLRSQWKYTFIHSLKETKELLAAIDESNVGIVLDSFHWYTAHESIEDILTLKNEDIVACDLNDVPVGRAIDEQIDGQRMLPLATGVIDVKSFLEALVQIGYDGPVRAEPFNRELNDLPNEAAVTATSIAMKEAFDTL